MEDRRVRDADLARQVLEAEAVGATLAQLGLGGVQDDGAGLLGGAANA